MGSIIIREDAIVVYVDPVRGTKKEIFNFADCRSNISNVPLISDMFGNTDMTVTGSMQRMIADCSDTEQNVSDARFLLYGLMMKTLIQKNQPVSALCIGPADSIALMLLQQAVSLFDGKNQVFHSGDPAFSKEADHLFFTILVDADMELSRQLQADDLISLAGRIESGGCLIVTGRTSESWGVWCSALKWMDSIQWFFFGDVFVAYKRIEKTKERRGAETNTDILHSIPGVKELEKIFAFIAKNVCNFTDEGIHEDLLYLAAASEILGKTYDLLENTNLRFLTNDYTDALLDVKYGGGHKSAYQKQYETIAERKAEQWLKAMEEEFSFSRREKTISPMNSC